MKLHPNAAVRVLRHECERMEETRAELCEAIDDPRIPPGVIADQIIQVDRELEELFEALRLLAEHGFGLTQAMPERVAVRAA